MNSSARRVLLFILFFVSGFSGLVYQVVWTRMAFASFGIITPVLSVVLSVFMLGLSIGAWASGRSVRWLVGRTGLSAVIFYAGTELLIGLGAFAVPGLFSLGGNWLLAAGEMDSWRYLTLSALVLAASILPWCVLMGATFPFMMAYIREQEGESKESFSYLYLANVLGAMGGTLLTAVVLVELLGFQHTLRVAAVGNLAVAFASAWLGFRRRPPESSAAPPWSPKPLPTLPSNAVNPAGGFARGILFTTGFSAMAMEVVWTRAFTPVLETQVYSYAAVVFAYLAATFAGSLLYRRHLRGRFRFSTAELVSFLPIAALLPIILNDSRWLATSYSVSGSAWGFTGPLLLLGSVCPLCAVLGYLTPALIDEHAAGHPAEAGKAYALNVLGCILGPLFASYVLLPFMSERHALVILGLPFIGFFLFTSNSLTPSLRRATAVAATLVMGWSLLFTRDFESQLWRVFRPNMELRRDYAASVASYGPETQKQLLVNGVGMTGMTPITKFMVQLPAALHSGRPESALVICFGMGTTYRSALSWDMDTTTVELVPGVTKAFGFYHEDAARVLRNPKGRIVVDDGRRFLNRTREQFDLIVVDPPPPVEAAGSSLLYSREFYESAKHHLNPNGILQAWFPGGDRVTAEAVVRPIQEAFPHVRCFGSISGWGVHLLASMEPIVIPTPNELAVRMPERARVDLVEWTPGADPIQYLGSVLERELFVGDILDPRRDNRITDDLPFNEYYLLRKHVFSGLQ